MTRSFPWLVLLVLAMPSAAAAPLTDDLEELVLDLRVVRLATGLDGFTLQTSTPILGVDGEASTPSTGPIWTLWTITAEAPDPTAGLGSPSTSDGSTSTPSRERGLTDGVALVGGFGAAPDAYCAPRPTTGPLDLGVLPRLCIALLVDPTPLLTSTTLEASDVPLGEDDEVVTTASAPAPSPAAPALPHIAPLVALAGVAAVAAAGASSFMPGSLLGEKLRRFGFLAILYTRLTREKILSHEARDAIFAALREKPGCAITDLAHHAGIPRNTATHHLHMLERQGMVTSLRKGRVRLYFPAGSASEKRSASALAALRHETTSSLARHIGDSPGVDQGALCAAAGIQPSLAHWHVSRLVESGLVMQVRDGRRVRYYPGDSYHLVMSAPALGPGA